MSGDAPGAEWPLTEKGRGDSRALGSRLANRSVEATIWTSPERRARETAALAFPLATPAVRNQLSEVGKPWYAGAEDHANAVAQYLRGGVVAGWEQREAVIARTSRLKLECESMDGIVLVSHGLFITTWLDHEIGLSEPFTFWSDLQMPDAWEVNFEERSLHRIA